eukprot:GHVU01066771.1.p2 GENE.GHVU01066771.1~~GHVU01066771.1.p2  ORF type:complete len:263 (-),score=56.33 GHVU01066771.1:1817-2605(-)
MEGLRQKNSGELACRDEEEEGKRLPSDTRQQPTKQAVVGQQGQRKQNQEEHIGQQQEEHPYQIQEELQQRSKRIASHLENAPGDDVLGLHRQSKKLVRRVVSEPPSQQIGGADEEEADAQGRTRPNAPNTCTSGAVDDSSGVLEVGSEAPIGHERLKAKGIATAVKASSSVMVKCTTEHHSVPSLSDCRGQEEEKEREKEEAVDSGGAVASSHDVHDDEGSRLHRHGETARSDYASLPQLVAESILSYFDGVTTLKLSRLCR